MSDIHGGPAFPCPMSEQTYTNQYCSPFQGGMSLRDYFAAKAMQAIQADKSFVLGYDPAQVADRAYEMADAMLKARETE